MFVYQWAPLEQDSLWKLQHAMFRRWRHNLWWKLDNEPIRSHKSSSILSRMLQQHPGQAADRHLWKLCYQFSDSVSYCRWILWLGQQQLLVCRCVDSCTVSGYNYAGLQYRTQCICANEQPHGTKQNESDCDYVCPGDSSANCGGHWMMSVYQTSNAPTTSTTITTTTTTDSTTSNPNG